MNEASDYLKFFQRSKVAQICRFSEIKPVPRIYRRTRLDKLFDSTQQDVVAGVTNLPILGNDVIFEEFLLRNAIELYRFLETSSKYIFYNYFAINYRIFYVNCIILPVPRRSLLLVNRWIILAAVGCL